MYFEQKQNSLIPYQNYDKMCVLGGKGEGGQALLKFYYMHASEVILLEV